MIDLTQIEVAEPQTECPECGFDPFGEGDVCQRCGWNPASVFESDDND